MARRRIVVRRALSCPSNYSKSKIIILCPPDNDSSKSVRLECAYSRVSCLLTPGVMNFWPERKATINTNGCPTVPFSGSNALGDLSGVVVT